MKQNYLNLKRLTALTFIAIMVSLAVSGQATLKHSYTFEGGNANDVVGNAHGALQGNATIADGAVTLTGGFVSLPGKKINVPSYGSLTVEAVFSQAAGLGGFTVLYNFGQTNPSVDWMGINYLIYQPTRNDNSNSRLSISCLNTNDPWASETGINAPKIADTNKHYVVTVLTATEMKLYLDGVLLGTQSVSGNNILSNISPDTAYIGRSVYTNDPKWQGTVYEMNVYNGELDQATILQHAESYLGAATIDASLASLSTKPGTLTPVFNKETDTYEITVPYGTTKVDIDAVPTISAAKVAMYDGLGNQIPEDGVVTFSGDGIDVEIIVTSINGANSQSYFVSIFIDPANESNRLSGINLSAGSLIQNFHPDSTKYTALVPSGTSSVNITGVPMWTNATVTGGGSVALTNGKGSTSITVTSEDGKNTRVYTVNIFETIIATGVDYYIVNESSAGFVVTESEEGYNMIRLRWPTKNNPAQLFHLEASGVAGQYYLKNKLNNYLTLTLNPVWDMVMTPTLTTNLDSCRFVIKEFEPGRFRIQSVARMATSNYDMGPNNPNDGEGIYSDKWPDNTLATWNIKLPGDVVAPFNTYLDTLSIQGINLSPDFMFYNKEYYITIPEGTTSLNIDAIPKDPTATVSGDGVVNVSGSEGSIKITVTATDVSYKTEYLIHYQVDPVLTLMHSYTFADGTAQDQEGELDGMAHGGSVSDGAFNSVEEGDYLTFSGTDLAINTYPSVTLEAYITTGVNPGWTMLAYFGNTSGANSYWMSIARNDNVSMTNIDLPGKGATNTSGPEPGVGENHHYVSVLTNDTIYWYIDGVLAGKNTLGSNMLIRDISTFGAWLCYGGYNDPTWMGSVHEFNIYKGQMDPTTVAARAVNFPVEDETSNASLSDLMVDGVSLEGFHPLILNYDLVLSPGTTAMPAITVTTSNAGASASVTYPTELPGVAAVVVTAQDGSTVVTYKVNISVEIGVAVKITKETGIKLYPTVSDSYFKVVTPGGVSTISVYDLTGKLVYKQQLETTEHHFTLKNAGMYIVNVKCNEDSKIFKVFKTN